VQVVNRPPPVAPKQGGDGLAIIVMIGMLSLLVLAAVTFETPSLGPRFKSGGNAEPHCGRSATGEQFCVKAE
jgi:hypothetical protein